MTFAITPLYAALITPIFLVLTARTILYRRGNRISLGPGDDPQMLIRMRAHGNCAEYAPFGLLLIAMTELQGAPAGLLHLTGMMLLLGRLLHGWGLSVTPMNFRARVGGMVLTLCQIGLSALIALWLSLS